MSGSLAWQRAGEGGIRLDLLALFLIPFYLSHLSLAEAAIRLFAGWSHGMSAAAEQFGAIFSLLLAQRS